MHNCRGEPIAVVALPPYHQSSCCMFELPPYQSSYCMFATGSCDDYAHTPAHQLWRCMIIAEHSYFGKCAWFGSHLQELNTSSIMIFKSSWLSMACLQNLWCGWLLRALCYAEKFPPCHLYGIQCIGPSSHTNQYCIGHIVLYGTSHLVVVLHGRTSSLQNPLYLGSAQPTVCAWLTQHTSKPSLKMGVQLRWLLAPSHESQASLPFSNFLQDCSTK